MKEQTAAMLSEVLAQHGLDPQMLIAVNEELLVGHLMPSGRPPSTGAAGGGSHRQARAETQLVAASRITPAPAAATLYRPLPTQAVHPVPVPTSINFPSDMYNKAAVAEAAAALTSPKLLACSRLTRLDLVDPVDLEQRVRQQLCSQSVRPLPILEDLERDLDIQRRALREHAAYTARCEAGTLYTEGPPRLQLLM